jgi:hypothetical protein
VSYRKLKIKISRTTVIFVVLNGCDTWFLTLGEEHRLKVFENSKLIRIFGPKRVELTGNWRILYNKELHNLYSLPHILLLHLKWLYSPMRILE